MGKTQESQQLRERIHIGEITCHCLDKGKDYEHEPGCYWCWAVNKVYELERSTETI